MKQKKVSAIYKLNMQNLSQILCHLVVNKNDDEERKGKRKQRKCKVFHVTYETTIQSVALSLSVYVYNFDARHGLFSLVRISQVQVHPVL